MTLGASDACFGRSSMYANKIIISEHFSILTGGDISIVQDLKRGKVN